MQRKVVPMIHVPDVRRTVEWYQEIGFEVEDKYGDGGDGLSFAILAFGGGDVMFSSGGVLSSRHRREVDLYVYTEDVDALHDRLADRVEVVEGPHNMFYGMRELIIRDLNGFWITFGRELSPDELTPWPAVGPALLQRYEGRFRSDDGLLVLITIHEGRLLAFPEDSPGVFLEPSGDHRFTPVMTEPARITFEGTDERMTSLVFEQDGTPHRFTRVRE